MPVLQFNDIGWKVNYLSMGHLDEFFRKNLRHGFGEPARDGIQPPVRRSAERRDYSRR